jgi:hypothetical protein
MLTPETARVRKVPRCGCMWSRPTVVLWVSVRLLNEGKRSFSFGVPLPTFLPIQWADMAEDVVLFLSLFPGLRRSMEKYNTAGIVAGLKEFGWTLIRTGPEDLADIDVESPGHRVSVKCLLR